MTCVCRTLRGGAAAVAAVAVLACSVVPAMAQEVEDEVRAVEVSYEIGAYDGQQRDWSIAAVVVRGDLDPEQDLNVELWGDGYRLWMGTAPVTLPETRLEVDQFVAVGELVEVGLWQELTPDETIELIVPPGVAPTEVVPAPEEPADAVDPDEDPAPDEEDAGQDPSIDEDEAFAPSEVGGVQLGPRRAEVVGGGSGGGSSGQLALSMVLTVVALTILFRTPLPSASTQRWTK